MSTFLANSSDAVQVSIDDVFLLHPKHKHYLQSKTRFSGRWVTQNILTLLLILLIMAVAPVAFNIQSWYVWNSLHPSGLVTEGKVVDRDVEAGEDNTSYYSVSYSYSSSGVEYTHKQDVSQSLYDRLDIGQQVRILYAPDDPNNALLADTEQPSSDIPFYVMWYGILALVAVVSIKSRLDAVPQSARGRVIIGTIEQYEGEVRKDRYFVTVRYSFRRTEGNQLIAGSAWAMRNDLNPERQVGQMKAPPPAPGTPVAILYRDDYDYELL